MTISTATDILNRHAEGCGICLNHSAKIQSLPNQCLVYSYEGRDRYAHLTSLQTYFGKINIPNGQDTACGMYVSGLYR